MDYTIQHPLRASVAAASEFGLLSPVVAEDDPRIIGGKLPDDAFYAL